MDRESASTCGLVQGHPLAMPDDDDDDELLAEPVIRTVAMPRDTNPAGDIFGGWLMSQMDLAAGIVAARRARGRCATVAVDAMDFHKPVRVGDEVSLYGRVLSVKRTSMQIRVEAWRRPREAEDREKVTEATFVFVALDERGKARPIVVD